MKRIACPNEYMDLEEEHRLSEDAAMRFKPLGPCVRKLHHAEQRILHVLGSILLGVLKVIFYVLCFFLEGM